VLDLQHITVRQVMRPLDKVASVTTQTPMTDVLAIFREKPFARLPVWQEEAGNRRVAGVLNLKDVLFLTDSEFGHAAGQHTRPALYLDDGVRLEEALRQMQKSGHRLAIVLGRDRREIGILSLSDILKVIFGEVNA
ncbi:MAG: CBS domain-containing protein, partial [Verrucomicrobia bacterium]|nr:CBS domain-containing protein [Verrucomicrobiota bacterium]